MRTIENERLRVEVSDHGAELSAVYDKLNKRNILWTADKSLWDRHAPILFPFVGRVYNNVYRYNGTEYEMSQHGFARDMEFECTKANANSITHILKSTNETHKNYPFDFRLTVKHVLEYNVLRIEWTVENLTDGEMYFSIGGHPGFMCPVLPDTKQTDYYVNFPNREKLLYKTVDVATGTVNNDDVHELTLDNGRLKLTEHTFDNDALVFDDGQFSTAGILYPDGSEYITLDCAGFPSFGVWSKPNCVAPFVCLEPWIGRCDNYGYTGQLQDKFGVQKLLRGGVFEQGYSIKIH